MIGSLRHKIELLTLSRSDDEGGGATVLWLPGPDLWARVERLTSVRDITGDRTRRLKRISATLRYRTDIVLGQQIRFEDDTYEVVSLESDDERDRLLILICEEVVS